MITTNFIRANSEQRTIFFFLRVLFTECQVPNKVRALPLHSHIRWYQSIHSNLDFFFSFSSFVGLLVPLLPFHKPLLQLQQQFTNTQCGFQLAGNGEIPTSLVILFTSKRGCFGDPPPPKKRKKNPPRENGKKKPKKRTTLFGSLTSTIRPNKQ